MTLKRNTNAPSVASSFRANKPAYRIPSMKETARRNGHASFGDYRWGGRGERAHLFPLRRFLCLWTGGSGNR